MHAIILHVESNIRHVKKIIGFNGETSQTIAARAGLKRMKINDEEVGEDARVTIEGTQEAMKEARRMLEGSQEEVRRKL